jgi:hypothetical protein
LQVDTLSLDDQGTAPNLTVNGCDVLPKQSYKYQLDANKEKESYNERGDTPRRDMWREDVYEHGNHSIQKAEHRECKS